MRKFLLSTAIVLSVTSGAFASDYACKDAYHTELQKVYKSGDKTYNFYRTAWMVGLGAGALGNGPVFVGSWVASAGAISYSFYLGHKHLQLELAQGTIQEALMAREEALDQQEKAAQELNAQNSFDRSRATTLVEKLAADLSEKAQKEVSPEEVAAAITELSQGSAFCEGGKPVKASKLRKIVAEHLK